METTHADRLVAEALEALEGIDNTIAELRAEKKRLGANVADLIEQRKPLARIVSAARGRAKGNGDEPDTAE